MKYLTTLLLLTITISSYSQTLKKHKIWQANAHHENMVEVADLNSDGMPDYLAGSMVFFNDSGSFNYESTLSTFGKMTIADFDGDNDLDMVQIGQTSFHFFENDGLGNFSVSNLSFDNLKVYFPISHADMNGDSLIDIVFYGKQSTQTKIYWKENLGNDSFAQSEILVDKYSSNLKKLILMDFDNDGDIDVGQRLGGYSPFPFNVLVINDGNFPLKNSVQLPSHFLPEYNDINRDSFPDLISLDTFGNIYIYLNNKNNSFVLYDSIKIFPNTRSIYSGDLNGDGFPDLILGEGTKGGDGNTRILYNNGKGNFPQVNITLDNTAYKQPLRFMFNAFLLKEVHIDDFNNDGRTDILVSPGLGKELILFTQKGNGDFERNYITGVFNNIDRLQYFDVNEDGIKDVVSFSKDKNSGALIVSYGKGKGSFSSDSVFFKIKEGYPRDFYFTNWNNNSFADLIYANSKNIFARLDYNTKFDTTITLFTDPGNSLPGNIGLRDSMRNYIARPHVPYVMEIADFDGDKDMDLFFASQKLKNRGAYLLENSGGAIGNVHFIQTPRFHNFVFGDITGDGYKDLIIGSVNSIFDSALLFSYDPVLKNFKYDSVLFKGMNLLWPVALFDPDNDGDLDIFYASRWMENLNGKGNFAPFKIFSTNFNTSELLFPANINGDGLIDFYQYVYPKLNAYINNGDTTFSLFAWDYLGRIQDIIISDVNSDGTDDVIAGEGSFYPEPIWIRTCFSSFDTVDISACDLFVSPGGNNWNKSGTYLDIIPNYLGCDSMITFNLTINPSGSSLDTTSGCGEFYWGVTGITYSKSGIYADTFTSASGCDSVVSLDLKIINLDTGVVNHGDRLESKSTGTRYQWLDCKDAYSPISGEIARIFSPSASGVYAVKVKNAGCADTSECFQVTITGRKDILNSKYLIIYPNPSTGIFKVKINSDVIIDGNTAELIVTDILGNIILKSMKFSKDPKSLKILEVDLSNYPSGVYFLKLHSQDIYLVNKLVKE